MRSKKSPPAFEKWLEEVLFLAQSWLHLSAPVSVCVYTHTVWIGEWRGGDDDIYTAKRKEEEGAATS